MRHPAIDRHGRQHVGACNKPGIRGCYQQPRRTDQRRRYKDRRDIHPRKFPIRGDEFKCRRIERFAFNMGDAPQQIKQNDAACGECQREGNRPHGSGGRFHPRFGKTAHTAADGFQPCIGSATERKRTEKQRQYRKPTSRIRHPVAIAHGGRHNFIQPIGMDENAINNQRAMGNNKPDKNRQQKADRLFHAA